MKRILILNGPNLNLLGSRDPEMYGSTPLSELEEACRKWGVRLGVEVETFQSNHEGDLIDRIHRARGDTDGLIINPGALTHYSYALHDAIEAVGLPTVEVHISNIEEREEWRRLSVIRPACVHTIYGRGTDGYRWAISHLVHQAAAPVETVSYGPEQDHVLDLRSGGDLIILVHGGFWLHQWTRDTLDGVAVDLGRRGFATANIEYRRTGKGGGWPQSLEDTVGAINKTLELTSPDRFAILGHSAGAFLAVMAAGSSQLAKEPDLLVTIGGIFDIESAIRDGVGDGAVADFIQGVDPSTLSTFELELTIPARVVHGSDDERVPSEQSRRFADAHGARLEIIEGGRHFTFLHPRHRDWVKVAELLVSALS